MMETQSHDQKAEQKAKEDLAVWNALQIQTLQRLYGEDLRGWPPDALPQFASWFRAQFESMDGVRRYFGTPHSEEIVDKILVEWERREAA